MSPPPSYADLGQSARNVLIKGFYFGLIKLGVKTKSSSGVNFNAGGAYEMGDNNSVFGSFETKYEVMEKGVSLIERWNTDNVLSGEIIFKETLIKNFSCGALFSYSPKTSKKSMKLKSSYVNNCVNLTADVGDGTAVHGSAVLKYQNFLGGYQCGYDTYKNSILKNNFSLAFDGNSYFVHTSVNDGNEFRGTIFQRINHKLDTCIHLSWLKGSNDTKFGVGAKYILDKDASIWVKVDNSCLLGTSYQQKIREGITLTLCALVDCKNFDSGGHKIGLALEMEA